MNGKLLGTVCAVLLGTGIIVQQGHAEQKPMADGHKSSVQSVKKQVFKRHGYKVIVENRTGDPKLTGTIHHFINTYFYVFPEVLERFQAEGKSVPTVTLVFEKDYDGVAYTEGDVITISADWIRQHPDDLGMLTHELTHVAQGYPVYDDNTWWLTEGIADYSRYLFGPEGNNWALPEVKDGQHYDNGYGVTARFLLWIEQHKTPTIVADLNRILQTGSYSPQDFVTLTGENLDELWADYVQNPVIN